MQLADILSPAAVRSLAQVASKKRLFHEIAELAGSVYGLPVTPTLDALQERESLGPTGVEGFGIAWSVCYLTALAAVLWCLVARATRRRDVL